MPTMSIYNHTAQLIGSGNADDNDTYYVLLLNDTAAFDATHTTLTEVTSAGANEVTATEWPTNGVALTNVSVTTVDTNDAMFDADDVSVLMSTEGVGPFSAYVLYDGSQADDPPLAFVELDAPVTITQGNSLTIPWSVNGIFRLIVA